MRKAKNADLQVANEVRVSQLYDIMRLGVKREFGNGDWNEDLLEIAVDDFFQYCNENGIKPTVPLLRLWLNITPKEFTDWLSQPYKYPWATRPIGRAMNFMEAYLQDEIEEYPTGAMFLLKTTHGHNEMQKISFSLGENEKIEDVISKLGLDVDYQIEDDEEEPNQEVPELPSTDDLINELDVIENQIDKVTEDETI